MRFDELEIGDLVACKMNKKPFEVTVSFTFPSVFIKFRLVKIIHIFLSIVPFMLDEQSKVGNTRWSTIIGLSRMS